MKKIIGIVCVLGVALSLVGCKSKNKVAVDTIENHIIEVRNNLFAGSDENFYATFCSGEREEPYNLDGVVNGKVEFGIITLAKNDNSKLKDDTYNFAITINGEIINGSLEKSPYDNTYSADIGKRVDDNAEISFGVNINGVKFEEVLYNESKNFKVTKEQAISIAGEELKNVLKEMKDENGKTKEAMVKILKDYSGETNKYFWYIGVVSADGKTAGILIDTQTGEIVSKKV